MSSIFKSCLVNWDDIPKENVSESIERQVIHGDKLTIAKLYMKSGASVQTHSHPNEQITWILTGHIRFQYGEDLEQVVDLKSGDVLHLPADIPHNAICLEDTIDFDIFTPTREDWKLPTGNDYFSSTKDSAR
ncbi:cupin domain-containing protein [Xenorhabdus sp. IM139775]|uniref:cupin domain-containing protein n=1 Tax=Xenorhabdus sp. IM139775 TaxID=3025876 RepID=UPI002359F4D7|nr:cupin domain-containing protein [Xenorhabdus sp. IM139775]MDC9594927.1 cupin domain-containing protein [Xenorhabdus sp. IM139775]